MPVSTQWENPEKTIYRMTLSGQWTFAEFVVQHRIFRQAIAEVPHRVISILDLRGAKFSIGDIIQCGQLVFASPATNVELTVVISNSHTWQTNTNFLIRTLAKIFSRFEIRLAWVKSDKEALDWIARYWHDHPNGANKTG